MQLRAILVEDDAVSSVLGVVLMVAVTIILAAVIGTFVLGIGEELTEDTPQSNFDYSFTVNEAASENSSVLILHGGGDELERSALEITIDGEQVYDRGQFQTDPYYEQNSWPEFVSSGDRFEFEDDQTEIDGDETLRIIWHSEEQAAILDEQRIS